MYTVCSLMLLYLSVQWVPYYYNWMVRPTNCSLRIHHWGTADPPAALPPPTHAHHQNYLRSGVYGSVLYRWALLTTGRHLPGVAPAPVPLDSVCRSSLP